MNETTTAVVITTEHRGVFFGYLREGADRNADPLRIERARMAVYWSADVRGVMGLAASGPSNGCRIGPPVPAITLKGITSVIECSPEAIDRWESMPWSK